MIESDQPKRALFAFPGQEKRVDPTAGSTERTLLNRLLVPYNSLIDRLRELKDSVFFGNSFGIYAALIASGSLTPENGAHLVDHRGQIVRSTEKQAAEKERLAKLQGEDVTFMGRTGMLRLIGIDPAQIMQKYQLNISNDYGLIKVVTGYQNALVAAMSDLGNPRAASILEVDGAYHDPKRTQDSQDFSEIVEKTRIESPKNGLVVSSTKARVLTHPDDIREELVGMMIRPVVFADILKVLQANGVSIALDLDSIASFKKITSRIDEAKGWLTAFSQVEQDNFFASLQALINPQIQPNQA